MTTSLDMEASKNDRLLTLIEEAAKKFTECSESTRYMKELSDSFLNMGRIAGRACGKTWAMTDFLKGVLVRSSIKRKMPRKQKKAFIKKNGRAAYYAWQRTRRLPQFTPWRVPIPEFKLEYIQPPMFPEPQLPERSLLLNLWPIEYGSIAFSEKFWQAHQPMVYVNPDGLS